MRRYGLLRLWLRSLSRAKKLVVASTPLLLGLITYAGIHVKERNEQRRIEQEAQEQALEIMRLTMNEMRAEMDRRAKRHERRLADQDERITTLELENAACHAETQRLRQDSHKEIRRLQEEVQRLSEITRHRAPARAAPRPTERLPAAGGSTLY